MELLFAPIIEESLSKVSFYGSEINSMKVEQESIRLLIFTFLGHRYLHGYNSWHSSPSSSLIINLWILLLEILLDLWIKTLRLTVSHLWTHRSSSFTFGSILLSLGILDDLPLVLGLDP